MRHLGFVVGLIVCLLQYGCGSGASGQTPPVDPIVGHWSFMQYSNGTAASINSQLNPNVCVGDIDIKPDLTYTLWNTCRLGDSLELHSGTSSGSGVQKSQGFYIFGSYIVLLSRSGDTAHYNNLLSDHPGHYEQGIMFKDVFIDHAALHR